MNNLIGDTLEHPLTQKWPEYNTGEIEYLYTENTKIYAEHNDQGGNFGVLANEFLDFCKNSREAPAVWQIMAPTCNHIICLVLGPRKFEFIQYGIDLIFLRLLRILGQECGRHSFLSKWQMPAGLLAGNLPYTDASGWWHTREGIVVCVKGRNSYELFQTIASLLDVDPKKIVHSTADREIINTLFRKATNVVLKEIEKIP